MFYVNLFVALNNLSYFSNDADGAPTRWAVMELEGTELHESLTVPAPYSVHSVLVKPRSSMATDFAAKVEER